MNPKPDFPPRQSKDDKKPRTGVLVDQSGKEYGRDNEVDIVAPQGKSTKKKEEHPAKTTEAASGSTENFTANSLKELSSAIKIKATPEYMSQGGNKYSAAEVSERIDEFRKVANASNIDEKINLIPRIENLRALVLELYEKTQIVDMDGKAYGENNLPRGASEPFTPDLSAQEELAKKAEKKPAPKGMTEKEMKEAFARLKEIEKTIRDLNNKYFSEMQREEKAILYSKLEKAQREYRALEEKLDTSPKMSERESKLLKLKALKEKIKQLNDAYFSEMQREEKAILWSQLEKAQREYWALEEELDGTSDEKKTTDSEKASEPTTPEKEKTPEEISARKILIILIERAKSGNIEDISILVSFIINIKIEWLTVEEREWKDRLIILWEKAQGGDVIAITNITTFINTTINIWVTINPPQPPTTTQPPMTPPQPPTTPGTVDDLRDMYLNAKRKRGNVFRGGLMGRIFGRKINFNGQDMFFGGKEGAAELEIVRNEYQKKLAQYRAQELAKLPVTATPAEKAQKMMDLLNEEQANIDQKSVTGIEKNRLEGLKLWWRNLGFAKKGSMSLGVYGTAFLVAGPLGYMAARAGLGGAGTYITVEAGLERFTKILGHKGLVNDIGKKGALFTTPHDLDMHIASLPNEDIKKEAARLRMLQVEKGIMLGNLYQDNNGRIALAIIKRADKMIVEEAMRNAGLQNPELGFANILSDSLAMQINSMNEMVEKKVDEKRIQDMFKKGTAMLAGGAVGWLIGGKLFNPDPATPPAPHTPEPGPVPVPPAPPVTPPPFIPDTHHVTTGEHTWGVIKDYFTTHHHMDGLVPGQQTFAIDSIKDQLSRLSSDTLKQLGFTSGNIDILNPGDALNMSKINNIHDVFNAAEGAQHLSPGAITSIVNHDALIANWFHDPANVASLKGVVPGESVFNDIIAGVR